MEPFEDLGVDLVVDLQVPVIDVTCLQFNARCPGLSLASAQVQDIWFSDGQ